ncbi:HD domain-containing protein [Phaeobacter porticola]|uniref:5'-deoxynucleotidase n=1 Tax=Phaeobacter porticola TaxID=1844006 RepID=A0A1L3I4C1_9RHOB|nr:HD domain-containing protein [Phaeobacter porticola]APG46961.1 putative hydrolase of HD superfamily protein [Phaeobacter porticola]
MTDTSSRLESQFRFLLEADKLRRVDRQNLILDGSRCENSAEHSWHLALYALVFAPFAPTGVSVERVVQMLLLHDLVEIDAGDHPIDEDVDWDAVASAEAAAATRLFSLLPADQSAFLHGLWREFEASLTPDAQWAKRIDHCQPIFQTLCNAGVPDAHIEVVRGNLFGGRATALEESFPEVFHHAVGLLEGTKPQDAITAPLSFLNEVDALKTVLRATTIGDGSRHENSAEHSWHIMLYAWVLAQHSHAPIDMAKVLQMLLLHDIVEIDAGDVPIHSALSEADLAAIAATEQAAAERIFGLLPEAQANSFRSIWEEFEAAESAEAIYAKAIDRVQPVLLNLMSGGGSWREYNVTMEQLDARVGHKVTRGAPAVWDHVRATVAPWFAENAHA